MIVDSSTKHADSDSPGEIDHEFAVHPPFASRLDARGYWASVAAAVAAPTTSGSSRRRCPLPCSRIGKVNVVIEASGVEPIGDGRRILVAHDKDPAFRGRRRNRPDHGRADHLAEVPQKNEAGPKWEGMARDSEGNYYMIGAHDGKTDEERATKSVLLRFRFKDSDQPAIDDASVTAGTSPARSSPPSRPKDSPPEEVAKRKIEGLAIREQKAADGSTRRELLIGLREPTDKVRAFVADISTSPSPDAELELKPRSAFEAEPREG